MYRIGKQSRGTSAGSADNSLVTASREGVVNERYATPRRGSRFQETKSIDVQEV